MKKYIAGLLAALMLLVASGGTQSEPRTRTPRDPAPAGRHVGHGFGLR